jgi:hypothetical protein
MMSKRERIKLKKIDDVLISSETIEAQGFLFEELKEALAHPLGVGASPEAALTVDKHRPNRITVARLRCRSPPIKFSINTFPLSL